MFSLMAFSNTNVVSVFGKRERKRSRIWFVRVCVEDQFFCLICMEDKTSRGHTTFNLTCKSLYILRDNE